MSDKKELIIASASQMIRGGGYNAFSFREIADAVGIKSSSVHHYFRRKEDLAVAVARDYAQQFFAALGPATPAGKTAKENFKHYSDVFINAFKISGKSCLCGILSSEAPALPQAVIGEVSIFIDKNIDWLASAYSSVDSKTSSRQSKKMAMLTYSALEGAMAVATLKQDVRWLTITQQQIFQFFKMNGSTDEP